MSGRLRAEIIDERCSLRARYLSSLHDTLSAYSWGAVILGLGMGERTDVPREIKTLMRETGTSHLMAISGFAYHAGGFHHLDACGVFSFIAVSVDPLADASACGTVLRPSTHG